MNPYLIGHPEIRTQVLSKWSSYFTNVNKCRHFFCVLHGVPVKIQVFDDDLFARLQDFFPMSWQVETQNPIHITWVAPPVDKKQGEWDAIDSPDCQFFDDYISQRDFLARKLTPFSYQLMANYDLDDGIFNFLRYLLPLQLLQQDKILFHSSCVVDEENSAYLFFGPSGAGKTTIAELCAQSKEVTVLGDDMNVISFKDEQCWIEGAAIGQRIFDPQNFSKQFPLRQANWLVQSKSFDRKAIDQGRLKFFLSSFANLFWDQIDPSIYNQVFKLLGRVSGSVNLFELSFKKSPEVFNYVRSFK